MRRAAPWIALGILCLHLCLGFRGVWQQDKNLFTQHPFSDPYVRCQLSASADAAIPKMLYRTVRSVDYKGRMYLELLPALEQGLQQVAGGDVQIQCVSQFDDPKRTFPTS